ncbi:hypothetical protein EDC01DRAFT_635175 [Geopyxis carbonaria]|nr:hypothetical protein EDC01DRAFT_635175 [Geopyxis carbonaria]
MQPNSSNERMDPSQQFNRHDYYPGMSHHDFLPDGIPHHLRPGFQEGYTFHTTTKGRGRGVSGHLRGGPMRYAGRGHQHTQSLTDIALAESRGLPSNSVANAAQFANSRGDHQRGRGHRRTQTEIMNQPILRAPPGLPDIRFQNGQNAVSTNNNNPAFQSRALPQVAIPRLGSPSIMNTQPSTIAAPNNFNPTVYNQIAGRAVPNTVDGPNNIHNKPASTWVPNPLANAWFPSGFEVECGVCHISHKRDVSYSVGPCVHVNIYMCSQCAICVYLNDPPLCPICCDRVEWVEGHPRNPKKDRIQRVLPPPVGPETRSLPSNSTGNSGGTEN